MSHPSLLFPAVRGNQAGMEYYISMVPLGTLPRLFVFSEGELSPEIRSQRLLNKARVPEIRDYIINNPDTYVFSAITATVDGEITFTPIDTDDNYHIGNISIPMSSRLVINDGQHRRAAIETALQINPYLKHEHISVVFYSDLGLKRTQQIFSDLNRYAIRTTKSLNILYDHRDDFSKIICDMADQLQVFQGHVEKERSTIPNRSRALFTLSGIFHGTEALLQDLEDLSSSAQRELSFAFWETVASNIPDWQDVLARRKKASDLRKTSLCAHSVTLIALGRVGNLLLKHHNNIWHDKLAKIQEINWDKDNPTWEGKVVINGHISGTRISTQALTDKIASVILDEKR